jgi:xylulokinase
MAEQLLLGVDVGTYETKGVLVTPAGEVRAMAVRPHKLLFPRAGWAEHDPEETWWGDVVFVIQELLKTDGVTSEQVAGVGISAIGPDVLPIDEDLNPLRMGILYGIDTRAVDEIAEMNAQHGAENIFQSCANMLSSQAVGPKMKWIAKHEPEIYRKARWFVDATTFIVARLTGRVVVDHFSAGNFHPIYDPWKHEWNPVMCEGVVEIERLPELAWSHEVVGEITPKAAEITGLLAGTPVTTGTIDAAAEALSVGVVEPGEMMLMYGSTIFIIQVTDNDQAKEERLWASPYLFPGTWCLLAGMATSGALTRWFRDQLAPDLVLAEEAGGELAYSVLAQEAANEAPGSAGLIVLPYFSGERTPINDPLAKGVIFGLSLTHTRAQMFRATLEGMGHGIRQHVDLFTSIGAKPKAIRAVGGGTKNTAWLQAVSDISGVPQEVAPIVVGASYGDAFLAGMGVGLVKDAADIRNWQGQGSTIQPNPELRSVYDPLHAVYTGLYDSTKEHMHTVSRLGY